MWENGLSGPTGGLRAAEVNLSLGPDSEVVLPV